MQTRNAPLALPLKFSEVKRRSEDALKKEQVRLALTSLSTQSMKKCALSPLRPVLNSTFSVVVHDANVLDQDETGLCWIHAGVSYLESLAQKQGYSATFSPHYLAFYDKLEKSAVFLKKMRDTSDERTRHSLLDVDGPILTDGGTWGMFVHLVNKYGLVPREDVILTHQATHTTQMNRMWRNMLRRSMFQETQDEILLGEVHDLLVRCLGTQMVDEITLEHEQKGLAIQCSPQDVNEKLFGLSSESHVCLVHAPDREQGWYTSFATNDVSNDRQHTFYAYQNLDPIVDVAIRVLQSQICIPFTADVSYMRSKLDCTLDTRAFDYKTLLGVDPFCNTKKELLESRCIVPNHAMMFVGVDLVDGRPVKWKVLNSWGTEGKHKGFLVMSHDWFQRFVFEITIPVRFVDDDLLKGKDRPIRLPAWDAFSTVAH
jgi:bleomycin hydrolase